MEIGERKCYRGRSKNTSLTPTSLINMSMIITMLIIGMMHKVGGLMLTMLMPIKLIKVKQTRLSRHQLTACTFSAFLGTSGVNRTICFTFVYIEFKNY